MKLKCVDEECNWESQDLNEGLAKDTLLMHLQLVHQVAPAQPQVGGTGVKKSEKFPRPIIDQDSTLELGASLCPPGNNIRMNTSYQELV